MAKIFIFFGLLIFCAHLFSYLFSRKRVPDVLLLLGIGIVLGPLLHWVEPADFGGFGSMFASLTLLFILFDSGVDMSIDAIRRYWKGMVEVTLSSFFISMVGVAVLMVTLFSADWQSGILLGSMVSGTAAAIVIPLVRQMRVSEKTRTTLVLESASSGVLSIVFTLGIIEGFKMGEVNLGAMVGRIISSFVLALIIGIVGGVLWGGVLDRVRKLNNSMFLTPAFVFVLFGICEALGYSGAIAALSFGVVLGNIDYFQLSLLHKFGKVKMLPLSRNEKSFFKEIVFVLKTFFFVYIGICIPFSDSDALIYGLGVTVLLFIVRFVLVAIVGRKNTRNDRLTVSIMIPKGLVSAVLASVPEQVNLSLGYQAIPGATLFKSITYAVIFFSIIITSLLVLLTSRRLVKESLPEWNEEYDYE